MSEQRVNIKFKFNVEITVTICHVNVNKLNPAVIGSRRVHLDFIPHCAQIAVFVTKPGGGGQIDGDLINVP